MKPRRHTTHRRKVSVTKVWEEYKSCGVSEIRCSCGFTEGSKTFTDGQTWRCPRCGNTIMFRWVGMTIKHIP